MNGITHKQAKRHMRADLDGLLDMRQRLDLQTHLRECDACRAESESLASLTARLQSEFHNRWDKQTGPSANVMANVHSQTRRIMLVNRINTGLRAVAGIAALLVLWLAINSIISQLKDVSVATTGTQSTESGTPAFSSQTDHRLIAFTSVKDGNYDIYTMHADGSGLTNITNNPDFDSSPFWSPDGKYIAFESGRDGSWGQIYLMNADGSNVVQLTYDQADHQFVRNYGASYSPWSPDGSRLIISQKLQGEEKWTLYTIDANGGNKTQLVSDPNIYNAISWSPDGRSIAFIADNPQSLDGDRLYIVNADGSNLREVTEFLLPDEQLFNFDYYWADDGQSIFFVAFSRKTEPYWTAYEARLDDNSLIEHATTNTALYYWQNSISVLGEFSIESPIRWLRSDETNNTLHPYEHCTQKDSVLFGSHMKRSSNGNWAINAYCPNGDSWFYYANSDGTMIKQLLHSPLSAKDSDLIDILWSPDDKFLVFNMASADQSDLYILDVSEALKDPSIQPVKMANSYGASWQPIVHNDIVEEKPTPEPPHIDNRLLAFTKEVDGNYDIYTMHADGSGLTNLTNSPANDSNPFWSPDGKRIAFVSGDAGSFGQIYLMDADGSDVVQLTHDQANHEFSLNYGTSSGPWSPDGSRLIFSLWLPGEDKWTLYTIDVNGENKTPLTKTPGIYSVPSWSPDGKHVAYIVPEPQENLPENRELFRIYVVDANGNNLTNITKLLPTDEDIGDQNYFWSSDGQSVFFIADRYAWENNSKSTFYEASLDGTSLVEIDRAGTHILDQWEGTSLILAFVSSQPLTWLRSDGTNTVLNAYEHCESSYIQYGPRFKRASNGDSIIAAGCANNDWWLYWANPDGTIIQQLLNSPISFEDGSIEFMAWSPDDQFIAFNRVSSGQSELYILNVTEALKDPSTQPVRVPVSDRELYSTPSWQPMLNNNVVEQKPTPEPTQIDNRLLAFTKEVDGNFDIFTLHADGSELTNLTNNSALDTNPIWSPDGTRIAFQSDRDGGNPSQIFLMDADGSNTTQLTTDAGDHMLPLMLNGKTSLWSPDGSKLLNMQIGFSDTEWTLQSIDINNGGITSFGSGRFDINNISWSPDGKHIAFVRNDPKNLDDNKFIPQMLIVSANGTDLINVNSLLPTGESWQYAYHWSRDGQSISFIASNLPVDSGYGFGSESGNPYYWKIYEVSLDGTLTLRATTHSPIGGWWDGNYFVTPIMGSGGWTWVHPDGSVNTINPTKECEQERLYDAGTNSYTSAIANFSQSPNGNGVIIASCPDGNVHLSWMNSTGTEVAPIAKLSTTPPGGYLDWVLWSQDDRFIAFQLYTSGTTDGYIYMVNIAESLKDPSIPPVKIPLGKGGFIFPLAWQPSP